LATEATTIVVDDDGVQCGNAGFGSIGAAVAAANPGDTVRVCPGIYRERVVVDKPLRLIGDREAVESVGCFEDTWSIADVIDPTVFPVIEPPDAEIGSLVQLQADGIELAGLVAQGQRETTTGKTVFAPAIRADGANAGHWIHHNLVQNNTFGIELGSNGTTLSRVDHNCLRGNDWALANQRYTTGSVRVDHNDVYNTRVIPFEVGTYAGGISDARFDHNRSVGSGYAAYLVEKATSVHLDHNTVDGAVMSGVVVRGDNRSVEISDNQLSGTTTALGGISLATPGPQAPTPSTDLLLQRNSVEHFNIGILLGGGSATADTRIIENVTRDNRVSGIQIGATNTSALVQGNVSDHNAYGIRTASPLVMGHSFLGNSMHLNTVTDAVEASFTTVGDVTTLNNIWLDNLCDTDSPNGTICVN
jgi:nitrous oxidase accessory protein NosD